MARAIAYCGGGVTPEVTTGSVRTEPGTSCGVTAGVAGISCGVTVRVATGWWRGSFAQSFQLSATRR